jgi:hypothetical protein
LTVPVGPFNGGSPDDDPVSFGCLHGNHLPTQNTIDRPAVEQVQRC